MGAENFFVVVKGDNPKDAFNKAIRDAEDYYGRRGYTGSIAEKNSYVLIPVPPGQDPKEFAEQLLDDDDDRVSDKWGPAGCIKLGEGSYLFFGYASS
jgi:hypothetical protein